MAVWYEQRSGNETTDGPRVVEPHYAQQPDTELLEAKYRGAEEKGWAVRRKGPTEFTAVKQRWGDVICTRRFWIED